MKITTMVVAILIALVIVGCGGGSTSTSPENTSTGPFGLSDPGVIDVGSSVSSHQHYYDVKGDMRQSTNSFSHGYVYSVSDSCEDHPDNGIVEEVINGTPTELYRFSPSEVAIYEDGTVKYRYHENGEYHITECVVIETFEEINYVEDGPINAVLVTEYSDFNAVALYYDESTNIYYEVWLTDIEEGELPEKFTKTTDNGYYVARENDDFRYTVGAIYRTIEE